MTQIRWAPTLPSLGGRLAPRIELPENRELSYNDKLQLYFLERSSCASIWSRRLSMGECAKHFPNFRRGIDPRPYVKDLHGPPLYQYLIGTLGHITMSINFQRKLSDLCNKGKVDHIKRWWFTTDGIVLAILMSVPDPDTCYQDIDKLIKFSLENCANNYADFTSKMKSVKRLMRKDYAVMSDSASAVSLVRTYYKMFLKHRPEDSDPHVQVRYLMCWTQTRASGLADGTMIRRSLDKCEETLSTPRRVARVSTPETRRYEYRGLPEGEPELPVDILREIGWRVSDRVRGDTAHISTGPNACIESTRQEGGQSGLIRTLSRRKVLRWRYDFCTLDRVAIAPSPVRSASDLVSWAIQETLEHPTFVRCVRLHAVPEPSKARTITVCTLPYLIVVGVLAKLLQPAISSDITRAGLRISRNLWSFLFEDLDPNMGLWGSLRSEGPRTKPILALSSDLSEATDYGDLGVARQILQEILDKCSTIPGFPVGLSLLAKSLFIGKRFCFRNDDGKCRFFVKRNGWLMGDRLTKVILTLAHEIVVRSSGLFCARICGDDIIAFSRFRENLERYLVEVERLGFKLSIEDTYISSRLGFYCEEACIPMQEHGDLPAVCIRKKVPSMYVDYVRYRLLIPTKVETSAYSYTDLGRFSLLGKECRWVYQGRLVGSYRLFIRGSLLQHLSVPQSADTLCPYLPIEIGGDGGFPHNSDFLHEVLLQKSRDFRETSFRMSQLLSSKWGYRFVRSTNLNDVIHKYHILVPRINELRALLPKEAIVEGNEFLLGSVKVPGLETPERTFFRIWRSWYWNQVLSGRDPPTVDLGGTRSHSHQHGEINLDSNEVAEFLRIWRDSGFTFRDNPDYLVDTRYVHVLDYLNMGWSFGMPPARRRPDPSPFRFLMNEENLASFIDHLKEGHPPNPRVAETLFKYVESDSYILMDCSRRWKPGSDLPDIVFLVSGDKKLALELIRVLRAAHRNHPWGFPDNQVILVLVPPSSYHGGLMDVHYAFAKDARRPETVLDHGSLAYWAYTQSGLMVVSDDPVLEVRYLYNNPNYGVYDTSVRHVGPKESVSLTTQLPARLQRKFFPWLDQGRTT